MLRVDSLPKTYQYITVDSRFVAPSKNTFTLNLGLTSNMILREMDTVVGVNLRDFYVTNVGEDDQDSTKFIDILCPQIPTVSQIIDERNGRIFARIPIERSTSNVIIYDKQWSSWTRHDNFFNPITINKLDFELYEQKGGTGPYQLLNPNTNFYMILEVVTINPEHMDDSNFGNKKFNTDEMIEKLCEKIDKLVDMQTVQKVTEPPEPKKISFIYLVAGVIFVVWLYFKMKTPENTNVTSVTNPSIGNRPGNAQIRPTVGLSGGGFI